MKYDFEKIGARIKLERLNKGWSQQTLAEKIGNRHDPNKPLDIKTIRGYENGNNEPPLYALTKLCELFNCELGYLLCEPNYEAKTRTATDIQKETGLSESAIDILMDYRQAENDFRNAAELLLQSGEHFSDDAAACKKSQRVADFISFLITSEQFNEIVNDIMQLIEQLPLLEDIENYRSQFDVPAEMAHFFTPENYRDTKEYVLQRAVYDLLQQYISQKAAQHDSSK